MIASCAWQSKLPGPLATTAPEAVENHLDGIDVDRFAFRRTKMKREVTGLAERELSVEGEVTERKSVNRWSLGCKHRGSAMELFVGLGGFQMQISKIEWGQKVARCTLRPAGAGQEIEVLLGAAGHGAIIASTSYFDVKSLGGGFVISDEATSLAGVKQDFWSPIVILSQSVASSVRDALALGAIGLLVLSQDY